MGLSFVLALCEQGHNSLCMQKRQAALEMRMCLHLRFGLHVYSEVYQIFNTILATKSHVVFPQSCCPSMTLIPLKQGDIVVV